MSFASLIAVAIVLVVWGCVLRWQIEREVARQLDVLDHEERLATDATREIKDEMRRATHRLLAAAIEPEFGKVTVVDASELDREDEQ